ncbi:quinone oxidoreductase family protein [Pimelobacter simplex]|uniref:quinone oxidoreductase family protein n=1 Tax=Nocardioides simplex TaxID=2045 RepID=UPI001EE42591
MQITTFGGPEALQLTEMPSPVAGPGQVVVDVDSAGINYADTLIVEDAYPPARGMLPLPLIPGTEVVGRTPDGRRVLALTELLGGYAERTAVISAMVHEIPGEVSDSQALAVAVQGLTAWHLLRSAARVTAGESVVVPAAAGGTGSLAVQLAKQMGAGRVIGMASSEEKRKLVLSLGADAAVDSDPDGLTERLVEANGGELVDVVLEATGGQTFDASLEAVAPLGRLVVYGVASGIPPQPVDVLGRVASRARSIIGFYLPVYFEDPVGVHKVLDELFAMTADGRLEPQCGGVYPLADAPRALADLRARGSHGKLVLDVSGWSD